MNVIEQILRGERYAREYRRGVQDLYVATVEANRSLKLEASQRLGNVIRESMGAAEILGALYTLRGVASRQSFSARPARDVVRFAGEQSIIPSVTFQEALEDFVGRVPVTLRASAERTAEAISRIYAQERSVAFVRSAEASVTKAAQDFIARAMAEGIDEGEAGRRLSMSVDEVRNRSSEWSEGYSRMAYRTNVNTAVTSGRFRQARDPEIKAILPAFRFDSVGDSDTRDNHDEADGMILAADNPAWRRFAPPLGYNCRCQVTAMSVSDLEQMGRWRDGKVVESRIPAGAGPDPGFRAGPRVDLF